MISNIYCTYFRHDVCNQSVCHQNYFAIWQMKGQSQIHTYVVTRYLKRDFGHLKAVCKTNDFFFLNTALISGALLFYHTIWPEKSEIVITFFAIHTSVLTIHQTKNEQSFPGSVQSSITYPFRAVGRSENPVGIIRPLCLC